MSVALRPRDVVRADLARGTVPVVPPAHAGQLVVPRYVLVRMAGKVGRLGDTGSGTSSGGGASGGGGGASGGASGGAGGGGSADAASAETKTPTCGSGMLRQRGGRVVGGYT